MKVDILYFGVIAEITSCAKEVVNIDLSTVNELQLFLFQKYPKLKEQNFRIAQNQVLVLDTDSLNGGEVAILPPFSGG